MSRPWQDARLPVAERVRLLSAAMTLEEKVAQLGSVWVGASGAEGSAGERAGTEVVQLYLHDPVATVARPVWQLAGFARVPLESGQRARVVFRLHADRVAYTGRDLRRVVEPGELEVLVGPSADDQPLRAGLTVTGPVRAVGADRVLGTPVRVELAATVDR